MQGHPHLPDGNTEARPVALDVDDELARLVAGEELAPPQPSHGTIATGDGWGYQMPLDADGKAIAPDRWTRLLVRCYRMEDARSRPP